MGTDSFLVPVIKPAHEMVSCPTVPHRALMYLEPPSHLDPMINNIHLGTQHEQIHFPNNVSTLKGSKSRSWGRCILSLLHLMSGFFPVTCPCPFRLRRLEQGVGHGLGLPHFNSEFWRKIDLFRCPNAFRLRGLGQETVVHGCPHLGLRHFAWDFLQKWLVWHVPVHFGRAGSHKTVVPVLGHGIFPVNSRISSLWWRSCLIPVWEVLAWSCTGPEQKILWRSWWGPPCCKSHVLEFRSACVKALVGRTWEVLVSRL